jgi:4a-hydroxytetrahydrobiopterin dehydratase
MAERSRYKGRPKKALRAKLQEGKRRRTQGKDSKASYLPIPKPLSPEEVKVALGQLEGWNEERGKLHRQFRFGSFEKALGFLSGLALKGRAVGHHPQESNLYNCVAVDLTTPEAGGITNLDVELAHEANELASLLN